LDKVSLKLAIFSQGRIDSLHMKVSPLTALVLSAGLGTLVLGLNSSVEANAPKVKYAQVKSLLDTKCVKCHNAKRAAAGVDLSSMTGIKKGGEHGPFVVAGKPAKSTLIAYVDGSKSPRMPLRAEPLSAKEINLLKSWVAGGAK
jgi:uncharacterized membrane protein